MTGSRLLVSPYNDLPLSRYTFFPGSKCLHLSFLIPSSKAIVFINFLYRKHIFVRTLYGKQRSQNAEECHFNLTFRD